MNPDWRSRLGLLRSLAIYWRPGRQAGLRRLYGAFAGPGDLVFDIGAHVGDRSMAFVALGARVIALEPQPQLQPWLRRLARRHPGRIILHPEAAGRAPGRVELAVNRRNPSISSASAEWRRRVTGGHPGLRDVRWDSSVTVPVTTLAALIERYGLPAFCKIDVEGCEAEVLAGLDRALPALSLEVVGGALAMARPAVDRLARLGEYEFNLIVGEGRTFAWRHWVGADVVHAWLDRGADGLRSGDLYARLPCRS